MVSKAAEQSVLVALDGSKAAQTAAMLAVQLAKAEELQIHGIHVISESMILENDARDQSERKGKGSSAVLNEQNEQTEKYRQAGREILQWLVDLCQSQDVKCQTEVLFGDIAQLIINKAAGCQIAALGRQGECPKNSPDQCGENFWQVTHHISVPLLVGVCNPRPVKRVLLSYNRRPGAQHALDWTVRLKRLLQIKVTVLAVLEEGQTEALVPGMRASLSRWGMEDYDLLVHQGSPAEVILRTIDESEADLLILGGHRHKSFVERMLGSPLDDVLRKAEVPLLVA